MAIHRPDPRGLFFDATPVAQQIVRLDGRTVFVNDAFRELFGEPASNAALGPLLARAAAGEIVTERPRWYEEGEHRKKGRIGIAITVFPLNDELVGVAYADVTAELERLELNELAQAIAHVGIWLSGIAMGDQLVWSEETYRIFGVASGSPITVGTFFSSVHPDDRAMVEAASEEARRSDATPYDLDHRIVRSDGEVRWLHEKAVFVRDESGQPVRMIGVCQDITERKAAEDRILRTEGQLRQGQKMEAIGRLAGGVAHDFNNLLSVILGYTSLLLRGIDACDPVSGFAAEIKRAGERASELTKQLLAFSRQQVLEPTAVDINQVIAGMESLLRRLLGEDIELAISIAAPVGRIHADEGQVEQVILNLAVNARDAMPKGGKLSIETSSVTISNELASRQHDVVPGPYVVLAVTDTGVGMDASTRAHMFEPFFTTKPKGEGTGLGLATIFGIVKQSGGHILATSERDRGTRFEIYFPRNDEPLARPALPSSPEPSLEGSETVLVVEDEDQVRSLVRTILAKNGYVVIDARNAGEALLACEQFRGRIHLLLTDVIMPRMTGIELAERISRSRPETKTLFMTGYAEGNLHDGVARLQKPITPDALLRKVREALR